MTALVTIEAVAIVLLAVLVAGLLRSHADILRALHQLGVDPGDAAHRGPASPVPVRVGASVSRDVAAGVAAADLSGLSPRDEAVRIAVAGARHDTLLSFLTTGCATCRTFWSELARPGLSVPGDARLVIVVHDPGEESLSKVRALAPPDVPVVMSSRAWQDYGVEVAPYFVYVSGPASRVAGEGAAATWEEISALVEQARADADAEPGAASGGPAGSPRRHRATGPVREARADEELMAAGIPPGDPRLYPTRLEDDAPREVKPA